MAGVGAPWPTMGSSLERKGRGGTTVGAPWGLGAAAPLCAPAFYSVRALFCLLAIREKKKRRRKERRKRKGRKRKEKKIWKKKLNLKIFEEKNKR
jgi:hypothetical protein